VIASVTAVELPSLAHDSGSFVTARGPSPHSDLTDGSEAGSTYRGNSISEPTSPRLPFTNDIEATHSAPEPAQPRSPHLSHYSSRASSIGYPPSIDRFYDETEMSKSLELRAANPRYSEIRNERRYRLTLQHEYHPSCEYSHPQLCRMIFTLSYHQWFCLSGRLLRSSLVMLATIASLQERLLPCSMPLDPLNALLRAFGGCHP
jgi:hypothetical protein